jgi:Holliday junction DNA helicase RuvA
VYESIHGRLVHRDPASAVIEAGGIGYRVHVPLSTYEALPAVGEQATLLLHLTVREDEWRLYGFAAAEERAVFQALLRVSGVGPVMALGLISGFRPAELRAAVGGADVKALTRVKGVGRKTAERIVVELRDVWKDGEDGGSPFQAPAGPLADAVRALESLGLDAGEARRRVERHAAEAGGEIDTGDLVRRALRG